MLYYYLVYNNPSKIHNMHTRSLRQFALTKISPTRAFLTFIYVMYHKLKRFCFIQIRDSASMFIGCSMENQSSITSEIRLMGMKGIGHSCPMKVQWCSTRRYQRHLIRYLTRVVTFLAATFMKHIPIYVFLKIIS